MYSFFNTKIIGRLYGLLENNTKPTQYLRLGFRYFISLSSYLPCVCCYNMLGIHLVWSSKKMGMVWSIKSSYSPCWETLNDMKVLRFKVFLEKWTFLYSLKWFLIHSIYLSFAFYLQTWNWNVSTGIEWQNLVLI